MPDRTEAKEQTYEQIIKEIEQTGKGIMLAELAAQNKEAVLDSIQKDTSPVAHVGATYIASVAKNGKPSQYIITHEVDCPDSESFKHIKDKEVLKSLVMSDVILQSEEANGKIRNNYKDIIQTFKDNNILTVPVVAAATVENILIQCNANINAANAIKNKNVR